MNDPHWHFWPGSLLLFEVDEETYINLIFGMQWPKKIISFFFCQLYGLSNYQTGGQTIHPKREQKSHKKKWVYCWQWVEQKFPFLSKAAANTSWSLHGRFPPSAGSKSYNELFLQNDQWPRTLRKKSNTTSTCTLIWN